MAYGDPASGVVCVVEIKAQFWDSYEGAYFDLRSLGFMIGRGGVVQ